MAPHSTNYTNTFITVAADCPVTAAQEPPDGKGPTIASLQFGLLTAPGARMTSDDLLFTVQALRTGVKENEQATARTAFFDKPQACLRSSPLAKRYGWGLLHDADGHVTLLPVGSAEYRQAAADPDLTVVAAMRSKRA
ncbi:hypothetical protein GIS00_18865 [Nakamurella sp. YIM 132087]|uniref:Uncharacterized protein n=1 Tax=Nakamurella alba TaxID=2665158 RepID=A0A7K1FPC8_9ACTN|nr:DUF6157 family protein [Nakamurella alba]MTD16002.1 hypothetical protein [Nakamurella alba]